MFHRVTITDYDWDVKCPDTCKGDPCAITELMLETLWWLHGEGFYVETEDGDFVQWF